MQTNHNLTLIYGISFFFYLIPAYVIERLFWEQRGMSVLDVVLVEIIFGVTVILLEVPSGMLADRIGRRPLIICGIFLEGVMFAIIFFAHSFWAFAFAIVCSGAGGALLSGANNALLFDTLANGEKEQYFDWHLGRLQAVKLISAIFAAMAGSLLAVRLDFEFTYLLSLCSIGIAFLLSLLLKEYFTPSTEKYESSGTQIRDSFLFFTANPALLYILMLGIVIGLAASFTEEFWQLYLVDAGIAIYFFGIFSAASMVIQIPGGLLAHYVKNRFTRKALLRSALFIGALSLILSAFSVDWLGAISLLLLLLVSGITEPIVLGALHEKADDKMRATLESFHSLAYHSVLIAAGLGFGYFATRYTVPLGFLFLGILCLAATFKSKKYFPKKT
ncbi:MFS transporter [Jeotgalibacillus proteolyticus]|uniref:MFS transporter n=1 Tax=Jeotgalibacillus proteolyticus TaxID=2082395 RepID=UPI0014302849|nr:MFS transporter [Jeotgalibacillus proteolyticus]